ncbi:MAG: transcription-repair coupling factor [Solirubrobacterales bacterium]|nr:transcription-repair coupling factor [Solirubrobacterales bacterium]
MSTETTTPSGLRALLDLAPESAPFAGLAVEAGAAAPGAPATARASAAVRPYVLAALAESDPGLAGRPLLCVAADDRSARDLATELGAYLAPRRVRLYPSRGTGYESHLAPPPHLVGLRIAALDALARGEEADGGAPVVVVSAVALAEAVPDASLRPAGFSLTVGEEVDLGDVAELLAGCGYERCEQVTDRGQFAVRGGILDVFGSTEDRAARIELFGDEIESIRYFSTFTQRSLADAERIELDPAAEIDPDHRILAEEALADATEDGEEEGRPLAELLPTDRFGAFLDLIDERTAIVVAAAEEIGPALADHGTDVRAAIHDEDVARLYVEVEGPLAERAVLELRGTGEDAEDPDGDRGGLRGSVPVSAARSLVEAEPELEKHVRSGYVTVVAFESTGEAERARYALERLTPPMLAGTTPVAPGVLFAEAAVNDGFISPALKLAVIPFRRLVHRRRAAAPAPSGGRLASLGDLTAGEHVVHEDHGVARFAGFDTRTVAGITRDYLELEYRDGDKVLVPAEQLAKITRYVGGGEHPELSKLGGKRWQQMKTKARRAAREMAGELINLYAERQARKGHQFSPDGEWQLQLERSFPYKETADQLDAIEAVKADMESERPMDRLICGDVGYGKTEVAIRAAQKALADSKQVMVLVPTTILAQQHLGTFTERMRDFPYKIEMISRLRKPAETKQALADFADGSLDILIGTHRLLSRDVRAEDLGLLVIDEEQRFGVKQKELLRQLKLRVDVLSMSATPIPRTMQMSLAGLRDISVIETPPEGRRPVRTYIGPYEEELVAGAIKREVARDGQVFFLHNRIETLHDTAERLRALVPGAKFLEAHGQLDEGELESTMLSFLRGEADVLVATTIIESGLDVPAANTLVVERADQLGLAQAYQIRGRVGRSRERAYAYMLYPSEEGITRDAAARLASLADHTELGSGFRIAMRDLELRGAGDLLGAEQSGHVAAIGFELYVEMLDQAVEELRAADDGGEPGGEAEVRVDVDVSAYVPSSYVPYEAAKIDIHRRIAAARAPGELRALLDELRDRFGPPPEAVECLLAIQRARIELGREGARSLSLRGTRVLAEPLELDSERVARLRERVPEAVFSSRDGSLTLRIPGPNEPEAERVAELSRLTEAVALSRAEAAEAA